MYFLINTKEYRGFFAIEKKKKKVLAEHLLHLFLFCFWFSWCLGKSHTIFIYPTFESVQWGKTACISWHLHEDKFFYDNHIRCATPANTSNSLYCKVLNALHIYHNFGMKTPQHLEKENIYTTAKWIVLFSEQSNFQLEKVWQSCRRSLPLHHICKLVRTQKNCCGGVGVEYDKLVLDSSMRACVPLSWDKSQMASRA